jgi:cell division protein ZapA (FtsZ GTPase activity inhibitor)
MEKNTVTFQVAGKTYTISSSDTVEYLHRVITLINRRIADLSVSMPSAGREDVAVAAMLSFADEMIKAQDDNRRLRQSLAQAPRAPIDAPVAAP